MLPTGHIHSANVWLHSTLYNFTTACQYSLAASSGTLKITVSAHALIIVTLRGPSSTVS